MMVTNTQEQNGGGVVQRAILIFHDNGNDSGSRQDRRTTKEFIMGMENGIIIVDVINTTDLLFHSCAC